MIKYEVFAKPSTFRTPLFTPLHGVSFIYVFVNLAMGQAYIAISGENEDVTSWLARKRLVCHTLEI